MLSGTKMARCQRDIAKIGDNAQKLEIALPGQAFQLAGSEHTEAGSQEGGVAHDCLDLNIVMLRALGGTKTKDDPPPEMLKRWLQGRACEALLEGAKLPKSSF